MDGLRLGVEHALVGDGVLDGVSHAQGELVVAGAQRPPQNLDLGIDVVGALRVSGLEVSRIIAHRHCSRFLV